MLPAASGGRDPVPTSVTEGPDGALYVSELTGFPFWQGTSSVFRLASAGSSTEVYSSGFIAVVDLAVADDLTPYVPEIARGQVPPFPPPNPGSARADWCVSVRAERGRFCSMAFRLPRALPSGRTARSI